MSEQAPAASPSAPVVVSEQAVTEKSAVAAHSVQTAPTPGPDITEEVMRAVARQIESYLRANGRDLQFSVDQESGRTVVTVRDRSTGEVIRQIPDAEALRIAQSIGKQPGALLDISI